MSSKYKIGIYAFYFGSWPEWIDFYFYTLARNPSIDFHFFTDCKRKINHAKNIYFHAFSFEDYIEHVRNKVDINIQVPNGIKLCDIRPCIGYIHKDIFQDYDFYGWTDLDILFGDIRAFVTDEILDNCTIFSSHKVRVSGHFSLMKNTMENRMMYKKIYKWKEALLNPNFVGIDEHGITNAVTMTFFDKLNEKMNWNINNFLTRWLKKMKTKKLYMVEQYSTPFTSIPWFDGTVNSEQPDVWYYRDGVITNNRDGDRNFMYLHFMNFKSSQWRHDGTKAPWEGKENIFSATIADMKTGIVIDNKGISKM